jgi:hypothetical protein
MAISTAPEIWFLSKYHVNGIYIPAFLLLLGTAICKIEWVPYAAILAVVLGGWQFYDLRTSDVSQWLLVCAAAVAHMRGCRNQKSPRFQEFSRVPPEREDDHIP